MNPFWIETTWRLPKSEAEDFPAQLEFLGSLGSFEIMGLTSEEEEARTESLIKAYFADTTDLQSLEKKLSETVSSPAHRLEKIERIPQAEWATEWKKYFKPFTLAPDLVIRPSWEEYTAKPGETVVTLDPGMAFGTGQHDTTRFCAEILVEIVGADPRVCPDLSDRHRNLPLQKKLLDVGCGSGILSIIAAAIGFQNVIGIDNDPAAIETANENLERNPNVSSVQFFLTDGGIEKQVPGTFDVVVANIIAEALVELKNELVAKIKTGGLLVLSGILPQRADLVKSAFADLEFIREKQSGDWHALVYRR